MHKRNPHNQKTKGFSLLHCLPEMQLFVVGSRDMNQEIYFIFIEMDIFFQKISCY